MKQTDFLRWLFVSRQAAYCVLKAVTKYMKIKHLYIFLLITAILSGCGVAAQTGRQDGDFAAAAEYSSRSKGLAMIVWKNGRIIFEEYQNGHKPDVPWMLASGTKSFSGVLLAAAIEDGIISGFDEKVADTITEWKGDPMLSRITLRQLLSLTGGLEPGNIGRPPSYSEAIRAKAVYPPGEKFQYGPVPFQVFGEVMRRKLRPRGEGVYDYLRRRILDPIGLKPSRWQMQEGQPNLPSGAYMTAREWLKFGEFMIAGGRAGGRQIVKKELLDALLKGSAANTNYGITFWLNRGKSDPAGLAQVERPRLAELISPENAVRKISLYGLGDDLPKDLFCAAGAGNQRLYIIPSQNVIIVRMGRMAEFDDAEFLRLLFLSKSLKG